MNANYTTNKILIDWCSFTTKRFTPSYTQITDEHGVYTGEHSLNYPTEIIDRFGLHGMPFEHFNGAKGYSDRLYFNGISIMYGVRPEIWVEMSGKGCRAFESFSSMNWYDLFKFVLMDDSAHFTRIDVAYDDFNGLLDLDSIGEAVHADRFVSKSSSVYDEWSRKKFSVGESVKKIEGRCISFGTGGSNISCRIYDKSAERGLIESVPHWVRCEIQLRHEHSNRFVEFLMNRDLSVAYGVHLPDDFSRRIDHLYFAVLNHFLRFIDPDHSSDTNKWRQPMASHWEKFVTSVTSEHVSLWVSPGVEYNMSMLDNYVERMSGAAVYTYMLAHGVDTLYSVLTRRNDDLKPKYRNLFTDAQKSLSERRDELDKFFQQLVHEDD